MIVRVQWHDSVGSTNDIAAALAEKGEAEGTVVAAEWQSAGRGRQGRAWASPPGSGLYASIILRPEPNIIPLVTIAAGVAIADAVARTTGIAPALKWPNDVMVGERKLAGILAEASFSSAAAAHVVLGFGLNLRDGGWPPDVAVRATSLERESGARVDRGEVLAACLEAWTERYDDLRAGRAAHVIAAWRRYAAPFLNRRVSWIAANSPHDGVAEDVDESGALVVRTSAGRAHVTSGEVQWT